MREISIKLYMLFSIFILLSSCQSKKENDKADLLQMILKDYYDRENNSKQNCTYIDAIYGFEKDIYHFVMSEYSCDDSFPVSYKTTSYKNKKLYLIENLPLSVENFTDIEFTQKYPYSKSEEPTEPDGIENFNTKPYFFYTVKINPYQILKIERAYYHEEKIETLYQNEDYKTYETENIFGVNFELISYLDTIRLDLRNQKIYKNNQLVEDKNGIKKKYFYQAIKLKDRLSLVEINGADTNSYHTLNMDVLYNDSVKKTFEIPLDKIRYNEDFEELVEKIKNVDNEKFFLPKEKVYRFVQQKAFPDYSFSMLSDKMTEKYPELETKIRLQIIIEKDGTLSEITFLDRGKLTNNQKEYLISILKNSGRWTPAKQNDSAVRMLFILPLNITP